MVPLLGLYQVDLHQDGRPEVIATGQNDSDGDGGGSFPIVVVLDPSRIVGKMQSLLCPDYGLMPATCELQYIRFPLSDMNELAPWTSGEIRNMVVDPSPASTPVRFLFASHTQDGDPMFEYVLTRDLRTMRVKSTDATDQYHKTLVLQGKLTGTIDQAYLENLKKGVRDFSGREWVAEPVQVEQSPDR